RPPVSCSGHKSDVIVQLHDKQQRASISVKRRRQEQCALSRCIAFQATREEPRASRYGSRCSPSSHETVALLPLPLRSTRMGVDRYPWRGDPVWQRLVETRAETGSDRIFAYQSSHDPWLTSSYYIETERGVVLFDTQLFLASAEELWADICRNTSG